MSDLKKQRRQLISQVLVLTAVCLLIAVFSWNRDRGDFTLHLPMAFVDFNRDDAHIEWDEKEIPVEKITKENERMDITFHPVEPGSHPYMITDNQDNILFYDDIRVSPNGAYFSANTGNFTGDTGVLCALMLFFTGMGVCFLAHFFGQRGPSICSYDAIAYFGGGIFCTATGVMLIHLFFQRQRQPHLYHMNRIFMTVSGAAETFILWTSPLVLLFSVLMIISNIALLRHERFRVRNILGMGIGAALIASEVFLFFFVGRYFSGSQQELRVFLTINRVISTVFAYFECILAGAVVCGFRAAGHVPSADKDYILILGCGFRKDGTLTPLLRQRVDKAIEFWKKQKETTGREAVLVPSGGQGGDEPMSESEAMTRYMLETGVPKSAIMMEDKSANTFQNMSFSKEKIEEREKEKGADEPANTIFVTTNYHVFRSGVWANLAGLPAEGLGSKTKWWFWPNAFIRECVGLLVNRIRIEIIWLIILVAAFSAMSYVSSALY